MVAAVLLEAIASGVPVPPRAAAGPVAPLGTSARGWLQVIALDVGQGDATFIRFPDGTTLLVDAGGVPGGGFDIGECVVLPALWVLGVRRLDYFAFTHGDPDHIGGAPAVVEQFRPLEVWEGIPVPASESIAELRRRATEAGPRWRRLQDGARMLIGDVRLFVWHPAAPDWERPRVRNDDSLVLELRLGDASVLLTGDIGEDVERLLATRLLPAGIRVLRMPHHGSRTSSSLAFLEAVSPALAFVSAGRMNRFGHPAPEVLARFRRLGTTILRTDRDGAVWLATDGTTVVARSMTGRVVSRRALRESG